MRPEEFNFDIQETDLLSEDFSQFFRLFEKVFKFYFFVRDAEGALTYISPKITEVLGYEPELFKKNWRKYLTEHLTNKEMILRAEFPQYSGKHIKPYSVEIKSKTGEKVWLDIHETPILDAAGNVTKYHGLAIDYTTRKTQENQLRMREKRFREISQSSPIGIFHADPNDMMTYVNPAWQIITGRPMAETLGNPWWQPIHPDDKEEVFRSWEKATKEEKEISLECRIIRPDKKSVWVQLRSRFLFDDTGKITFGTLENISERKASQEKQEQLIQELLDLKKKLEVSARTDPLTELPNRRGLSEKLEYEKIRFDRGQNPFTIIMGDIDHFKNINDNHGHDAGDYVLTQIARLLKENSRKQDVVSRWGGEEFIILLPETDLENGAILAEKLRKRIEKETFVYQEETLPITMSFGLSVFNHKNLKTDDVVKQADECLYEAKNSGRNRVVFKKLPVE
ncbi:MAG: diguanylate cyclase [Nitrospinaceae bacterium]|nr:diguanylate cyclase [Nitrospinaceae bacterium]NIR54128.1 diguanylate cyclase [Nitrospinaceae bacterium]NIS87899.1 diguanylate cyclase [Nitrospinaceae bacterium]NIT84768.1 diguanylate cyclase [Nitrospinaceae bacterium]NIU46942.1 diguanylate cyclase [Nitrospinaceae bacterium]